MTNNAAQNEITLRFVIDTSQLVKPIELTRKKISTFSKQFAADLQSMKGATKQTTKGFGEILKAGNSIPFQGWAMSIMFFGMQIQRTFQGIAKSAVSTFQEVMHSGSQAVTVFDILSGVFKFLSFTVGEAIASVFEPFVPIIISIVMAVTEFVQNNRELVGTLIIVMIILGALMFTIGTLVLGIIGLYSAFLIIKTFLATTMAVVLFKFIAIVALVAALFLLLWVTNLGNFREFFVETFGIVWETVKAVFGNVFGFVKHIFKAIGAFLKGDTDEMFKHIVLAIKHLLAGVIKLVIGLVSALSNILTFLRNLVIDVAAAMVKHMKTIIETGAQSIVDKALKIINYFRRKAKKSELEYTVSLGSTSAIDDLAEKLKTDLISKVDVLSHFEDVDKFLGLDKIEDTKKEEVVKDEEKLPTAITNFNISELKIENPKSMEDMLESVQRMTSGF